MVFKLARMSLARSNLRVASFLIKPTLTAAEIVKQQFYIRDFSDLSKRFLCKQPGKLKFAALNYLLPFSNGLFHTLIFTVPHIQYAAMLAK